MSAHTTIFLSAVLAIASFFAGCFHDAGHPPFEYGESETDIYTGRPAKLLAPMEGAFQTFYVPYVEEIVAPSEVIEDTPFTIEVIVSAHYRPVILRGYPDNPKQGVIISSEYDEPITLSSDTFAISPLPDDAEHDYRLSIPVTLLDAPGEGEPIDRFVFDVPGLSAGSYAARTMSVKERRWGGIGWYYDAEHRVFQSGDPLEWMDYVHHPEFVITVTSGEEQTGGA